MIFIIGRTGVGKDYLGECLHELHGLKPVISHTNRPMRVTDQQGWDHHFHSGTIDIIKGESRAIAKVSTPFGSEFLYPNVIASTKINGWTYFATVDDFSRGDYYVIDPEGLFDLLFDLARNGHDFSKDRIIWLTADPKDTLDHIQAREDNPEQSMAVHKSRALAEDSQFKKFELLLRNLDKLYEMLSRTMVCKNDYNPSTLEGIANQIRQEAVC